MDNVLWMIFDQWNWERLGTHAINASSTEFHWESTFVGEIPNPTLSWGWEFLERTQILTEIQSTRHCIKFIVVETKWFVSSDVNVILKRQTCGQRSSMSAGSKRQLLAFYFSIRIWYLFWESKCRGDCDLGLCKLLALSKRMPLHSADFRLKTVFGRKSCQRHCAAAFFLSVSKLCTDLDRSLLYILILINIPNSYGKWTNKIPALDVCLPQTCSSAGRRFCVMIMFPVLPTNRVCCSVLQCGALCCSVVQCVAVCCSVLQCVGPHVVIHS